MRVLIVGYGYVGQALGAELVRQGHEVFGLRRSHPATSANSVAGIIPLAADITRPEQLQQLPHPYDWVVNCVGSSGGGPEDYTTVYLQGTLNLVQWLSRHPPQKFVYTSSTSVYGQCDGSLVTESSPTEPAGETAKILVQTERTLLATASFPAVILRVAGIYGPGRGYWLKRYLDGQTKVEGADTFINMIHRDDVTGAIQAALTGGSSGEIYNAVDDEPVTPRTLFRWLCDSFGTRPSRGSAPEPRSGRSATNKRVSNQNLKAQLGYQFRYPTFREGYAAELSRLNREPPRS